VKRGLIVVAACGSHAAAPPDAPPADAAPIPCTATFSGNFAESSTGPANCPTGMLTFSIPTHALGAPLDVKIELASPTAGAYSSETVATWSARAVQLIGNGICLYSAGNAVVPQGSFTLELDSVDPAHGTLAITQYVLVYPETDCGDADTELVRIVF
jgi:hypothetical protein